MQMRRNGRNRKKILAWLMLVIMGVNCFDGSVPAGGVALAVRYEEADAGDEETVEMEEALEDASVQTTAQEDKDGTEEAGTEEQVLKADAVREEAVYKAKTISSATTLTEDMEVGDLTVNSYLYLNGHKLTVHGNLYLNSSIDMQEGYLHVKGNLTESYNGRIAMNSPNDYIVIEGDYGYYQGGYNYTLTNGTVEIMGDVYKAGESSNVSSKLYDSSCKVVLSGAQEQTIDLQPNGFVKMSHIVIENTSEEGVFSQHALNCDILEDKENKLYFAASGSNGEVLSEDQTIEGDYTLLAGELDLAGYTLTVRGNFIHAGGKVNVNGGSLVVEGDYIKQYLYERDGEQITEQSTGRLLMRQEQDYVLIKGSYIDSGVNSMEEDLTAGTLELKGSMKSDASLSYALFCASKNHTVKLTGSGKQMIGRGEKYSGSYIRFANLVVAQEAAGSTVFEEPVEVCGKISHETTHIIGTTRLDGAVLEGSRLYGDVEFSGNVSLDKDFIFSGDVYAAAYAATAIKNSHVTVEGNFYQNNGSLAVSGENGVFTIQGDYVARGSSQHTISGGTIELAGDMVREKGYVMAAEKAELVFTGTREQHIELSHASTRLENIVVDNPEGVVAADNVAVINVSCRQGVLSYASGGIHGFTLEEDGVYDGDLVIAGGVLDLNGHSYHVRGNLTIKNGVLKMANEQDYLLVDGDFETDSTISHSGYLTAGTLELKGNFTQAGNSNSFQAAKQHRVVFSGEGTQKVAFTDNRYSYFANLELDSKEKTVFSTDVRAYGTVTQNCLVEGTLGMGNATVFAEGAYQGDVRIIESVTLQRDVTIDGDVCIENSVRLNLGTSRLEVSGTVMLDYYSYLDVQNGSLFCGSLIMNKCDGFYINEAAARVTVQKDIYFSSYCVQSLKAGTITIGGDIAFDNYNAWIFAADVNVILNGSGKQTVTMSSTKHTLGNLILQNASEDGVYVTDYLICQAIDNTAGTRVTFADGGILGYTLDADEVIEGDLLLSGGEMDLNGHTLTVKGDLIQSDGAMKLNGGSLDIEGNYYIAKRTEKSDGTDSYALTGAKLIMTQEKERVTVHKNLYTAFSDSSNMKCTDGTIELLGDFQVLYGYFYMGQASTLLFNGMEQQKITFNGSNVRLGGLTLTNEKGITCSPYLYVNGNLQTNGYPVIGTIYCQFGMTMLDDTICASLYFPEKMDLQRDIRVVGDVKLGGLTLNGYHLTVEGNCTLNDVYGVVQPDGILEIKGNIISSGSHYSGSGTNRLILSGDTKQTIADGNARFCFQELVIRNTSEEGVYSAGLFDVETVTDPEHKLTFYTEGEAGYTLTKDTVLSGDFIQLLGTMDLNGHTLTVMGDYIQKNGVLRINGGALKIQGSYTMGNLDNKGNYVVNHARLVMDREADTVYVEGDVRLVSGLSLTNDLIQGTIEMKGNLSYECRAATYLPPQFTTVFSGERKQTVSQNGYDLRFGTIRLSNTSAEGVILAGNITINNPVTGSGKLNGVTGKTVYWTTGQEFPFTEWEGNLYLGTNGVTMSRDLNVKGEFILYAPLDVNGKHLVAGSVILRHTLKPNGGVVQVQNDFTVQNYYNAGLEMEKEADIVQITGNMTANYGELILSAGTLEVKGNLTLNGAYMTVSEKHNTILSGKMTARGTAYTQKVTCKAGTKVGTLTLTKPRDYYVFSRDVEDMCGVLVEDIQDITAPTAPAGLSAADVSYTRLTLSWNASTDDTGVAGYDIYRNDKKIMTVSGTTYTDRNLAPDTEYTYYVAAKDATLNTSALSKTVTVTTLKDEEAPAVPQGVELRQRYAAALTISWQASRDNVETKGYHIYRNGELIKDTASDTYTDSGLEVNTHYVYQLTAYDAAGNESELSEEYSFYTQAVEIEEISPDNYAKLSGTKTNVTVSFANAGSTDGYQVYMAYREEKDGEYQELFHNTVGKNTTYRQQITASAVLDTTEIESEEIELLVRITDVGGSETEEHYTYYLDRSAPSKLSEVGAEVRNGVAVISFAKGTEADIAGYRIYRQQAGNDRELFLDSDNPDKTYYYDKSIEEGVEYTYYVSAYDEEGLEGECSDGVSVTGNADEEEPRIESVAPLDGTLTGKVELTIHASDNKALDYVAMEGYDETEGEYIMLAEIPVAEGKAGYTLDTTQWKEELTLRFTVYDAAGNSNGDEFVCTYEIDNQGPEAPEGLTAEVRSTTVLLSWDNPVDADYAYAVVEQLTGEGMVKEIDRTTTTTGCVIEGLAPEETVQYQVTFYDQSGNRGETSEPVSVTVGADTIAPRILSAAPNGGYYNTSIPIQVKAYDNMAVAEVVLEYSYDQTTWEEFYRESLETPAKEYTVKYSMELSDKKEGELYLRAYSVDTAGNEGDREQILIQCIVDKTAPAAVDKLTAEGDAGNIHLKWNEPVDNDVAAYRLYRSVEGLNAYRCIADSIRTKDYYDRSASYDTSYSYKLTAVDYAGNESEYSNVAVGQKLPDDAAPKVHSIVPEEDSWISGTTQLSVYVSDNDRIASVEFALKSTEEGSTRILVDTVETDSNSGTVSCDFDTKQYANGVYQICVTAKDAAGNTSEMLTSICHICNITLAAPQLFAEAGDWCTELHYTAEPEVSYVLYRKNEQTETEFSAIASGTGSLMYRDNNVNPRYNYAYRLMIQDKAGNCAYSAVSYVKSRAVDKQKPAAVIQANTSVVEGYEIVFNGMDSTDNDRITSYTWDFGDDTSQGSGPYPVHAYKKAGDYNVTLTVEDASGNVSDTTVKVTVLPKSSAGKAVIEVKNAAGSPLKNVTVYVNSSSEHNDTSYTDKNGQAVIMQKPGTYRIALYKPGYVAVEKMVEIELHGERQYVFTLDEGETMTADFTVRQMDFDELVDAGIDLSDPANQHVFTVQTKLSFMDDHRNPDVKDDYLNPAKPVVTKGGNSGGGGGGSGGGSGPDGGGGTPSTPDDEIPESDFYYTIRIDQSISWLKDMYEATLIVYNNANSQTMVAKNLETTLQLPQGLSLAGTSQGQSLSQKLPDLKGGESGSVTWYVRGDTPGKYRLNALLTGTLLPFDAGITCSFESNEFDVTAGDGLVLTIQPEDRAEKGEQYYVYFTLSNEGSKEFYNVYTTFGTQHNNSKRFVASADGSRQTPVMSAGDGVVVECLKPGESISGIYKTALPVKGEKWFDYKKLVEAECKVLEGENLGVRVRLSVVASHVPVPALTYPEDTGDNTEADPVNVSTGGYTDSIAAMSVQGVNPVSAELSYDSNATAELGEFGYGWTHNYETRILDMKDGTVRYYVSPTGFYTFLAEDYESKAEYKMDANGYLYLDISQIPKKQSFKCLNENKAEYELKRNAQGAYTLTDAAGNTTRFDEKGNLTSMENKEGKALTIKRTDKSVTVTDKVSGRHLTYTLNADKMIESVKDGTGRTAYFYYDDDKCLKQFTNALGESTYYTYDKKHRILTVTGDDNVTYVTNTYVTGEEKSTDDADAYKAGRVKSQKDALGNVTKFSYKESDEDGSLTTTVTTRNGQTKKTVTDAYGNITCQTNEAGDETLMTYDEDDNQTAVNNANGYSTVYRYDSNGNMTCIENSLMNGDKAETVMTYDSDGNMLTMKNCSGESMRATYYDNGLVHTVTDQNQNTITYTYNDNGQLLSETDANQRKTEYSYDKGDLVSVKDKNGNVTTYTYNKQGQVEKTTIKDTLTGETYTTTTLYDELGRTDTVMDTEGGCTFYEYDCRGNLTAKTEPAGARTVYSYDGNNQVVKEAVYATDASTEPVSVTAYAYTKEGLLKSVTDGKSGTVIENTYDKIGNKMKEVEKKGNKKLSETHYEYDLAGNVTKETAVCLDEGATEADNLTAEYRYYPNGKLNYSVDTAGTKTTYTYDDSWRVSLIKSSTQPTAAYTYDAAGRVKTETIGDKKEETAVTSYAYDIYGNVTEAVDAEGNRTLYRYDGNGNLLETEDCTGRLFYSRYDSLDRVVETGMRKPGSKDNIILTTLSYSIKNHTVTEKNVVNGGSTTTWYDTAGRAVKTTDGDNNTLSETIYDTESRVLQTVDAKGMVTENIYNALGQLVRVSRGKKGSKGADGCYRMTGEVRMTDYTYDELGRNTQVMDAMEGVSSVVFDSFGRVISMKDPNQNAAEGGVRPYRYTYDEKGLLTEEENAIGNRTEYQYNDRLLLEEMTDSASEKTAYTYDSLNRLETVKDELGTVTYTYDLNGNLTYVSEKAGLFGETKTIKRTFDSLNRVTSYTDYQGREVKYAYDELGNLMELTYPGGEIVRYTYHADGSVAEMTSSSGGTFTYGYDDYGRLNKITRADGSTETREYDAAGQLVKQVDKDKNGSILQENTYEYDVFGEVTKKTTTNSQNPDVLETVTMTYNDANRLVTYNGQKVKYDEKGNMTYGPVDGVMQELTYDCRNRLVEAGGVSYTYDAENTRIATTENGLTTEYVTDTGGALSRLLVAYEADNTETTYYYGAEGLAAQYNSGTGKYYAYHYDNIGSTTLITAKDGHAVERFSYGTYGELLKAPITKIRFLYNGSYGVTTDSNGLYYMRARYYNPDIKRFINQDIKVGDIGSSQSLNRYAYCEGNPVSMVDPFGLCGEDANEINWLSVGAHFLLGLGGMIPGAGFVFDLADAALCYYENDTVGMALSLASAIPFTGLAAGAGKLGRQAFKFGGYFADVIRSSGKVVRSASKTADIAEGARNLLRFGIPEKFAAFTLKGSKAAKVLQKGGDALKDVGSVMKHQGEKIYSSVRNAARNLRSGKGTRGVLSDYLGVMEENFNGHFYSIKNKIGGNVFVSVDEISSLDFKDIVKNTKGKINILSGVHGDDAGNIVKELEFFYEDQREFASEVVKVFNYNDMDYKEIASVINSPDTTIAAWCFSEKNPAIRLALMLGELKE